MDSPGVAAITEADEQFLHRLPRMQKRILCARFGLMDTPRRTIQQLVTEFPGFTVQDIRSAESRAVAAIRGLRGAKHNAVVEVLEAWVADPESTDVREVATRCIEAIESASDRLAE